MDVVAAAGRAGESDEGDERDEAAGAAAGDEADARVLKVSAAITSAAPIHSCAAGC